MMHTAIKAFGILAATLAILCGCSRKEQPKTETPPPAPQKEVAQTTVEKTVSADKKAPASTTQVIEKSTEQNEAEASRPKLQYYPKPAYPLSMQARCIEGEARVTMRITTEGKPEDIKIAESTNPAFSDALMKVLPSWRFIPAQKDGVAVARTVSIAIPFIINNRPVDLPQEISGGKPELLGVARPQHSGKGAAKALVQFTITSETIVSDVQIISTEGIIDRRTLLDSLDQWVFLPSRYSRQNSPQMKVLAEITFTGAGNVLIQYPYPTPQVPATSGAPVPQK